MKTYHIKFFPGEPYEVHQQKKVMQANGSFFILDIDLSGRSIGLRLETKLEPHISEIPPEMMEITQITEGELFPSYEQLVLMLRKRQQEKRGAFPFPPGLFPPGFNPFGGAEDD